MPSQPNDSRIIADEKGIHFRHSGRRDIVLVWGEIAAVAADRGIFADGTPFLEIYVDHISGVDFRFHNGEQGYGHVVNLMEKKLIGFSRAKAEAVSTSEEICGPQSLWTRDEILQPFELLPPEHDSRPPTLEETARMKDAHEASIATCERILGRRLHSHELDCIHTGFENGRIVGSIKMPLSDLIAGRQPKASDNAG